LCFPSKNLDKGDIEEIYAREKQKKMDDSKKKNPNKRRKVEKSPTRPSLLAPSSDAPTQTPVTERALASNALPFATSSSSSAMRAGQGSEGTGSPPSPSLPSSANASSPAASDQMPSTSLILSEFASVVGMPGACFNTRVRFVPTANTSTAPLPSDGTMDTAGKGGDMLEGEKEDRGEKKKEGGEEKEEGGEKKEEGGEEKEEGGEEKEGDEKEEPLADDDLDKELMLNGKGKRKYGVIPIPGKREEVMEWAAFEERKIVRPQQKKGKKQDGMEKEKESVSGRDISEEVVIAAAKVLMRTRRQDQLKKLESFRSDIPVSDMKKACFFSFFFLHFLVIFITWLFLLLVSFFF
jgi:hypothetical protein